MSHQREDDPVLAEMVNRLVAAFQPERIYLFGSRARGEAAHDSDYDLLVVVPNEADTARRRSRLAYQALRGTRVAADVIVKTRDEFESRLGVVASLPSAIAREGKLLYAA
ncbi:MAG: nucleotidyltransferase domain-containing protein [Nitrospinae bacterium]|nr:nucleotidyltransferase domain-containing protein [Nitrospinota bacterium]